MAGRQIINFENVSNPDRLTKILTALYEEVTAIRTLINELRDDHATFKTVVDELKTDLSAHTHTVTHAQCGATGAAYGTATNIASTAAPTISASAPATLSSPAVTQKLTPAK